MLKQKRYEESFKRRVVLEVLSGKISQEEARRRYQIHGKSTILKWMRAMAGLNPNDAGTNPMAILQRMNDDHQNTPLSNSDEQERLRAEVKRLKAALEHATLKGRAYEIMLEIGKEQYGIDLEKKLGAKQSKDSKKNSQK